MEANLLQQAITAVERGVRALAYYSPDHPVFAQHQQEATQTLLEALKALPAFTWGCAGSAILCDARGTRLTERSAQDLARRMFELSVVGIRFESPFSPEGFGKLLEGLAHNPQRIRAQGGLSRVMGPARGIQVLEVDFDRLFRGEVEELAEFVGQDPVAELAVRALLRWRDEGDAGVGDEIRVDQEAVKTPEALGEFLNDLLEQAEPQALDAPKSGRSDPNRRNLGQDEVAELAARAFWTHQRSLSQQKANPETLAAAADQLSSALVRLAPEARFQLLQRLAGGEEDPEDPVAVRRLGERLDDQVIVDAVASALVDGGRNDDLARSVGDLIRRLRPVAAERNRLLQRLGQAPAAESTSGSLWQELRARALDQPGLGLLEMRAESYLPALTAGAVRRRRGEAPPVLGQDVLFTADDRAVEAFEHQVVVQLLRQPERCGSGLIQQAKRLSESLEAARAVAELVELWTALLRRSSRGTEVEPEVDALIQALFAGPAGTKRAAWLLKQQPDLRNVPLLLACLQTRPAKAAVERLLKMLAEASDSDLVLGMKRAVASDDWSAVQSLVRAGARRDGPSAATLARYALQGGGTKTKEACLRSLAERDFSETVTLLAQAAGAAGDRPQQHLLGLSASDRNLKRLRRAAIGALGLTRTDLAAQALGELLFSTKLFETKEDEEIRLSAAQALVTNGSQTARRLLQQGGQSKKRAIRDVCLRVGTRP